MKTLNDLLVTLIQLSCKHCPPTVFRRFAQELEKAELLFDLRACTNVVDIVKALLAAGARAPKLTEIQKTWLVRNGHYNVIPWLKSFHASPYRSLFANKC